MIGVETNDITSKLFKSLLSNYHNALEHEMKNNGFIF